MNFSKDTASVDRDAEYHVEGGTQPMIKTYAARNQPLPSRSLSRTISY